MLLDVNKTRDRIDGSKCVTTFNEPVKESNTQTSNEPKTDSYEDINVEYTEHMLAYKFMMRIYSIFADCFGITVKYTHRPVRTFMFWFASFLLFFTWITIIYTVAFHCSNGQYSRVLEPLAISGIAFSVIKTSRS